MRIKRVDVQNIRNLEETSFEVTDALNFFCGPNGAGKSSILEAIYLLSSGRSYRTHTTNELINWQQEQLMVRADFCGEQSGPTHSRFIKKQDFRFKNPSGSTGS